MGVGWQQLGGVRRAQRLLKPYTGAEGFPSQRCNCSWQDPFWSPMSSLACGSASRPTICVFEVGNFLFSKLSSYEKRNPSDSVAFLGVISRGGWNWHLGNGVWTWRIKAEGWCVCVYVCTHVYLGWWEWLEGQADEGVFIRTGQHPGKGDFYSSSFLDAALLDGLVSCGIQHFLVQLEGLVAQGHVGSYFTRPGIELVSWIGNWILDH